MTVNMRINTGKRTHDVRFISSDISDVVFVHMDDDRMLSEIALEFEGLERFEITNSINPKNVLVYEGYSDVTGIERYSDGSVRVTLRKKE